MSVILIPRTPAVNPPSVPFCAGTEVSFAVFFGPEDGILGGELQVREEFAGVTRTISLRRESSALRGTYTAPGRRSWPGTASRCAGRTVRPSPSPSGS